MPVQNPLNLSETDYIIVECFHIAGLVLAIGLTAVVDFRLLGLTLRQQSAAQLASDTTWWVVGGLITSIFAGLMLFSTDPDMYYTNLTFLIKMACLILAIVFNYTVHRKVLLPDVSPGRARLVGCLSLTLWVSIIFGGIFIANNLVTIG
jgi:hypothetical protein